MDGERNSFDDQPIVSNDTVRLTFSYTGSEIHLTDIERLEMVIPPSEVNYVQEGQVGFWVELRDNDENVLYQRVMHNPLRNEMEVYDENNTELPRWVRVNRSEVIFEILVPYIAYGQQLVIFSSPLERIFEPATEIARFKIHTGGNGPERKL